VPLTEKTRLLIGGRELNMMKPGAILVNIARGEIIDEQALEEALKNKKIHSAAVDVLTAEPVSPEHPLLRLDNFIITPHIAGLTREAAAAAAVLAAEGVLAVLNGEKWPHVADIRVYDHPVWKNGFSSERTDIPEA
jgi:D-3-phosphoglycerate dehydrogenase